MGWRWGMVMLLWLTLSAQVLAQNPASRPGASAGAKVGGLPPRMEEERPVMASIVELVAVRMSQLEEDLQLQPKQMPAWTLYRERVQRLLDDRRRLARTSATEPTAPQRLDALADGARNRLAAIEDVVDAGKALYALLTPEQRSVADRRLALPLATLAGPDTRGDERGGIGGRPAGGPAASGAPPRP
ncbi:MAG: Spy/CpxP family protein refolding chaperone [Betaproteobacteria bacterium]